jgi:hypothetical protein
LREHLRHSFCNRVPGANLGSACRPSALTLTLAVPTHPTPAKRKRKKGRAHGRSICGSGAWRRYGQIRGRRRAGAHHLGAIWVSCSPRSVPRCRCWGCRCWGCLIRGRWARTQLRGVSPLASPISLAGRGGAVCFSGPAVTARSFSPCGVCGGSGGSLIVTDCMFVCFGA